MTYTVRMVFLNQGETPPAEQLDAPFASVREAWDAGTARVLELQLRSTEAAFQVLDESGQIVEVTAGQIDS
ncbi:hypothetical protein MKK63_04090 [Methylobacterium sp. J-088]|uniref:hypothetical protein n=1 Tax=Methylobacterium sp. J-088 TaxID=2836664 RepID=UPI001FB926CF|nr:hypothetical protein [Methylobacterium sp. J-088]MCJ2061880.1 hypothetical protein [Methylobacterium sp. J-088]